MRPLYTSPRRRQARIDAASIASQQVRLMAEDLMTDNRRDYQTAVILAAVCDRDPVTFKPLPLTNSTVAMVFPSGTEGVQRMFDFAPILCACGFASSLHMLSSGLVVFDDLNVMDKVGDVVSIEGEGVNTRTRLTASDAAVVERFREHGRQAVVVTTESDPWTGDGTTMQATALCTMHSRCIVQEDGLLRWADDKWTSSEPSRRSAGASFIAKGMELAAAHSDAELTAMFRAHNPRTAYAPPQASPSN